MIYCRFYLRFLLLVSVLSWFRSLHVLWRTVSMMRTLFARSSFVDWKHLPMLCRTLQLTMLVFGMGKKQAADEVRWNQWVMKHDRSQGCTAIPARRRTCQLPKTMRLLRSHVLRARMGTVGLCHCHALSTGTSLRKGYCILSYNYVSYIFLNHLKSNYINLLKTR